MSPDVPPDPRFEPPDDSWRPKYYFVAAVAPGVAWQYPTLKPGKYYPVMMRHPHKPTPSDGGVWVAPRHDAESWVYINLRDRLLLELQPGDAWEGEPIQPMEPPE